MNILGISGLENSVSFKQLHWPGLDPGEYRILVEPQAPACCTAQCGSGKFNKIQERHPDFGLVFENREERPRF